eukprot:gene13458-19318_t
MVTRTSKSCKGTAPGTPVSFDTNYSPDEKAEAVGQASSGNIHSRQQADMSAPRGKRPSTVTTISPSGTGSNIVCSVQSGLPTCEKLREMYASLCDVHPASASHQRQAYPSSTPHQGHAYLTRETHQRQAHPSSSAPHAPTAGQPFPGSGRLPNQNPLQRSRTESMICESGYPSAPQALAWLGHESTADGFAIVTVERPVGRECLPSSTACEQLSQQAVCIYQGQSQQ